MTGYTGVDIEATTDAIIDYATKTQEAGEEIDHGAICIAQALLHLSDSIRYMTYRLGTADAASPMGALEMVGSELNKIADALSSQT